MVKNNNFKNKFNQKGDNRYFRKRTGKLRDSNNKNGNKEADVNAVLKDAVRGSAEAGKAATKRTSDLVSKYTALYNSSVKRELHYTLTGKFKCATLGKHVDAGANSMAKGNCVLAFETNEPNVVVLKSGDGRVAPVRLTSNLLVPMAWQ